MTRDRIIAITGNTATGTTTLAKRLSQLVGWESIYSEVYFHRSPFFTDFLRDPVRWAFHNQVFFLAEYIEGYQASTQGLAHGSRVICLDYTAHELAIYTDAMRERGFIDINEYRCIKKIFHMFEPMLYEPDLLIYLHASIDTIIERIQHRNRQFETEMDRRYLDHLQYGFDRFIASWTKGTVVKVDSEKIDFLHNDDVVRLIATQALNTIAPSN